MIWKLVPAAVAFALGPLVAQTVTPIVIAHRGASGHRPEHTLEAYALAIEMGADAIEPDLVSTKDGVLISRHENEIGGTTDVAEKFPERKTAKTIDGKVVTGWFTEDLTMAEILTLKAKERLAFRSHAYDGQFRIPTFDEVAQLASRESQRLGRAIAIYPELKHPAYFTSIGLPLEERLLERLAVYRLTEATSPVFIQCFEPPTLQRLRPLTKARLVLLTSNAADVTPTKLAEMKKWADGLGAEKKLIIPEDGSRRTLEPTSLVNDAHAAGLFVHVWTMRNEADFLSPSYANDPAAEVRRFVSLGVDGLFSDFPDVAVGAIR